MHLHIDCLRSKPPHMHLTPAVYGAAARRHPELARQLEVTYAWDNEDFDRHMRTADILFAQRLPKERLCAVAPSLKWINVPSAGVDSLMPLDWLPEGVILTNNSGTHAPKGAESAVMAILMLNARLPAVIANQRAARWEQIFTPVVSGKTVTVVGFGNIGRTAAQALRQFGLRIRAVRRNEGSLPEADELYSRERLRDALEGAHFLLVAAPLTKETRGMIGGAELDRLAAAAGVVNIGRGPIVDYDALMQRLGSGRLGGAVLDVFEEEPLPAGSPLWNAPNLILMPHISSDDPEQYLPRALDIFFDNLARMLDGRPMRNVIDRDLGY